MSAARTVARAAWDGAGRPVLVAATGSGSCSRCGAQGPVTVTSKVVSKSFTALDSWLDPRGVGLCAACVWLYRDRSLRECAHLVRSTGQLQPVTLQRARAVLARELGVSSALVVPLQRGRKHVMPAARWGQVATDDAVLTWGRQDAHLLHVVATLRDRGVPGTALGDPVPPWTVLAGASARERGLVLAWWRELDPWRAAGPWLRLAVAVTSPGRGLVRSA